jgi:hypothetical protein
LSRNPICLHGFFKDSFILFNAVNAAEKIFHSNTKYLCSQHYSPYNVILRQLNLYINIWIYSLYLSIQRQEYSPRLYLFRELKSSKKWLKNSVALVLEQTVPAERPPLVNELVPTFANRGCCVVSATDPNGRILVFLDRPTKWLKCKNISWPCEWKETALCE